jgi:hypothetical protein
MLLALFFSGATGADCLDTGSIFTFNSTGKNVGHLNKLRHSMKRGFDCLQITRPSTTTKWCKSPMPPEKLSVIMSNNCFCCLLPESIATLKEHLGILVYASDMKSDKKKTPKAMPSHQIEYYRNFPPTRQR